jgi:rhodanese-related sulfurtransferase
MMLAADTLQRAGRGSVTPELARDLLAQGGQLVDLRSPAAVRDIAWPGALNLPMDALGRDHRYLDKREPVIVCGAGDVACVRAARMLAGQGFAQIYHLDLPA